MNALFRIAALMFLVLSRSPAMAAVPNIAENDSKRNSNQNEVCSKLFKHSLSGLYGIESIETQVSQPYSDFNVLYSKAHQAQCELETTCKSIALQTNSQAVFAGVKSQERALQKVNIELDGQADKITDLARATIVADDIASLVAIYEALSRDTEIIRVKNRFKKPRASGYRDLNVLVKLPKTNLIAEVQLHLKAIAEVKSGPEHDLYEEIQKIERKAASESRAMNHLELASISRIQTQSKDLYQNAWQPYITTQLEAA